MVAVLFARADSNYKALGCDVWDAERDARRWPGGDAVVAHPPCRAWGRLRAFAKPRPDEKPQRERFIETARELGVVETAEAFERAFKAVSQPHRESVGRPGPAGSPKPTGHRS